MLHHTCWWHWFFHCCLPLYLGRNESKKSTIVLPRSKRQKNFYLFNILSLFVTFPPSRCACPRRCGWLREAFQHNLADRGAAFDLCMSTPEVGGVDGAEVLSKRAAHAASVHELGHLVEQLVLALQVGGVEHRAREHELPVQRQAFGLELHHVERRGRIVDEADLALRREQLDELVPVPIGLREAGHVRDRVDLPAIDQPLHLRGQRLAVVDHRSRGARRARSPCRARPAARRSPPRPGR